MTIRDESEADREPIGDDEREATSSGSNGFSTPQQQPRKGYSVARSVIQPGSSFGLDDGRDTSFNRTPGPDQDDYTRWHSQCELQCRECGKVYSKAKLFKLHLVSRHRMKPGTEYRDPRLH